MFGYTHAYTSCGGANTKTACKRAYDVLFNNLPALLQHTRQLPLLTRTHNISAECSLLNGIHASITVYTSFEIHRNRTSCGKAVATGGPVTYMLPSLECEAHSCSCTINKPATVSR
jgi:hypothetical protein